MMETRNDSYIFEQTAISLYLATRPDLFPSVKKLSLAIIDFLDDKSNVAKLKEQLDANNGKMFKELIDQLYIQLQKDNSKDTPDNQNSEMIGLQKVKYVRGMLGALVLKSDVENDDNSQSRYNISLEDVIADIKEMLTDGNANLIDIFPIFSTFNFRILKIFDEEKYKKAGSEFADYQTMLGQQKARSVKKTFEGNNFDHPSIPTTRHLGIPMRKEYQDMLNGYDSLAAIQEQAATLWHRTSYERFKVLPVDSPILDKFIELGQPMIAGPSTHTITLLNAVIALEGYIDVSFDKEERLELLIGYMANLAVSGYHTAFEVLYTICEVLNIELNTKSFADNLPDNIKNDPSFQKELRKIRADLKSLSTNIYQTEQTLFYHADKNDQLATVNFSLGR